MWPASERLKATNSLCVSGVSQVSTELLAECCSYATLHLFRSAAYTSETVWQDLVLGLRYWVMHYTHTHTLAQHPCSPASSPPSQRLSALT